MGEFFPVNAGNIPIPPSQSTTIHTHPLSISTYQHTLPTTTNHSIVGPGMRRKQKEQPRSSHNLKLERIIGLTTASSNILASAESQDLIAYAAGAVVVLYNHKRNKQVGYLYRTTESTSTGLNNQSINGNTNNNNNTNHGSIISTLGSGQNDIIVNNTIPILKKSEKSENTPASNRVKPISCLAFSSDGKYLAAGEMGHQPRIIIWNVNDRILLHQYRAHKFGVLSVAFSPNSRYLVSVGFQHDGYLNVWNWKKGNKLASNKVTSKVNALSFSKDGSYFVTAGLRHVKYWYFKSLGKHSKKSNLSSRETQVLDGRSGILGTLRDCNFVDVACDKTNLNHVYFITDTGILCVFKEGRGIDKWVNLQVSNAYSIKVSSSYIICSCSQGIIRLFEPITLKYYGMLPKPHPLGMDISAISSPDMLAEYTDKDSCYPDAVALTYDESTSKITTVYSDRSFYMWDIKDMKKIGKYRSFIAHTDCVWGVEPFPIDQQDNSENNEPINSRLSTIPPNSFVTYSADGTVRFWNLDHIQSFNSYSSSPLSLNSNDTSISSLPMSTTSSQSSDINIAPTYSTTLSPYKKNIYSRELIKMIYVDPDAAEFSKYRRDIDMPDDQCPDFGIRSLKIDKKGNILATGDRNGNLRVHDMSNWEQITYQEAHDSEILSIDISNPSDQSKPYLIATGSRDRLLHIFDIRKKFQLVQSLDDHSSSITSVRFTSDAEKLISSGADKGLIFREYANPLDSSPLPALNSSGHILDNDNNMAYINYHNYSGRSTIFDMTLDITNRYVATVTGERRLFIFNVESGKPFRICKPETAEEIASGTSFENSGGSLINIDLDPLSGTFAVTSGSDRCIRLFDLVSGNCVEKVCAHAELITSVKFIRSPKSSLRIISTCSDGTIFIWSVGKELINRMKSRSADHELKLKQATLMGQISSAKLIEDEKNSLLMNNNNHKLNNPPRLRRMSTATMIRPTPTLSQMIRQGERKTFSTVSNAEQKYDDLYKKASLNRKQRDISIQNTISPPISNNNNNNNNNTLSSQLDINHTSIPTHRNTQNLDVNIKSNGSLGKNKEGSTLTKKKSNEHFHGKLDRLYNGVPTTRNRDRIANITNYRLQQQTLGPSVGQRMNPVLRKQLSRDSLYKKDNKDGMKNRPKSHEGIRRASLNTVLTENHPPPKSNESGSDLLSSSIKDISDDKNETNIKMNNNNNNNCNTENNMNDMNEDEDTGEDDDEEEEQIIYILPSQDVDEIGKPIEVINQEITSASASASASSSNSSINDDGIIEGRKTPTSDNDKNSDDDYDDADDEFHETNDKEQSISEEDDDDESDENTDEAMIQAITSREAPRMTTSLSRTVSSSISSSSSSVKSYNKNRLSLEFIKLQQQKQQEQPKNDTQPNCNKDEHNSIENETISTSIIDLISPSSSLSPSSSPSPPSSSPLLPPSSIPSIPSIPSLNHHIIDTNDTSDTKKRNSFPGFIKDIAAFSKLHKKLEKSKKRQSITARFLSSLTDKKGNQHHESIDNVLNSFKEIETKTETNKMEMKNQMNHHHENENNVTPLKEEENKNNSKIKMENRIPIENEKTILNDDELSKEKNNNQINEEMDNKTMINHNNSNETKHSELTTENKEINLSSSSTSSPFIIEKNEMENILSDLDGAKILLESVLESYITILKKRNQQQNESSSSTTTTTTFLSQIEMKLKEMTHQVNKTLSITTIEDKKEESFNELQYDPNTLAMLDKYSTLLVKMVESKIK